MSRFRTSLFALVIVAMVVAPNLTVAATASARNEIVDASHADQGYVTVNYQVVEGQKVKVLVEKDGSRYVYPLPVGSTATNFPLQLGSGEYRVRVMENVGENRYRTVHNSKLTASIGAEQQVFLQSIQIVDWQSDMEAVQKARELVAELKTDSEKVAAIYQYVVQTFAYDSAKLGQLPSDYLPSITSTWETKSGICYDFASLFAAMLRSVNVSAKLVKGYTPNVTGYHAWNEVYLSDVDQWVTIDTSYDAQLTSAKRPVEMVKPATSYSKVYEY